MKPALTLSFLLLLAGCNRKTAPNSSLELEKQFEQMMTGSALVGHSTLDGKAGLSGE